MKIVIPMAGAGKRLRPHTLTVPKPLIPIAGKPIVHRLVEDIVKVCAQPVEDIAFVVGHFGEEVETQLQAVAAELGARGHICYQEEPLGTGHAILCAQQVLEGPVVVAFADTLFRADFKLDASQEGIVWVQRVADPSAFGVVQLDAHQRISGFVEKPTSFVSDLAIIGIYYFREGAYLKSQLQYLIDHDVRKKGEYQLTDALENMRQRGTVFVPGEVIEWLDCGNKAATVHTHQRYLESIRHQSLIDPTAKVEGAVLIPPVYLGPYAEIHSAVVGPYVSVGAYSQVIGSVVRNSIVQTHTRLEDVTLENSMIGNFVSVKGQPKDLSLGDYNQLTD